MTKGVSKHPYRAVEMRSLVLRLCLTFLLLTVPCTRASGDEVHLAITNVTVIHVKADSAQNARRDNQTVLIAGNKITRVAPSESVDLPANAEVVDGSGMYLVPGFQDMHAHVAWSGDDTTKIILPLLFANGITGIREMGSDNEPPQKTLGELRQLKAAIERGDVLGPRVLGLSRRVNGRPSASLLARVTYNPLTKEHGQAAARNAKSRGVDFIKVYSHLSREAFFGLMDEANRLDLPVAGHLPHAVTPIEASNAGMRSIEHARFPAFACGPGYEAWRLAEAAFYAQQSNNRSQALYRTHLETLVPEFDEETCREILSTFAKNGTWLCPTHTTRQMDASADVPEYRSDPRRKYIAPDRLSEWDRDLNRTAQVPPSIRTHFKAFFKLGLRVTGLAHQHGVPILVGTDCYDTHVFPGFSYHDELQYLSEAGLPPLDILKAATIRAAEFLKIDDESGSIDAGKLADMVLLKADPLSDIRNTTRIHAVIFDGKLHPQDELQRLIQGAESYVAELRQERGPLVQLWDAVISSDLKQLQAALKQGVDVNALDTRRNVAGGNGRRALNYAAIADNPEMIQALLDAGANIDMTNRSGYTPLMHAAESGSTKAATTLINAGASLSAKSRRGQTALEIAEAFKHEDTAAVIRQALSTGKEP